MTEDDQYDRNIDIMTRRMKFVAADGSMYVNFNMTYHIGTNFTKIKTKVMFDANIHWLIMITSQVKYYA